MSGFLILLAMFLVLFGTGPLMVWKYHVFVSGRYRLPAIGEVLLQMLGRAEEVSSVEIVIKRMRGLMKNFSIKSLKNGAQRIYLIHTLSFAPQDHAAVSETIGVRGLCQDYADEYAALALRSGWIGNLREPLEIYVIPDLTCTPNHPRLSGTRPASNHQPHMVVALLPESFSSGEPAGVYQPSAEPVTVGPAATLPYGPNMSGATRPGATKHLPPDYTIAHLAQDVGAEEWMRDVPRGPAILNDGSVAAYLGRGPVRIGRGSDCEVFLNDATVSRSHAALDLRRGSWALLPEEGKRCYINGEFADAVTFLSDRDVLTFASSPGRFEFRAQYPA